VSAPQAPGAPPPDGEYRCNPDFDGVGADPVEHINLVRHCAKRFRWAVGKHMDMDDIVQAGCVGLVQAAQRFDAERGKFSTYAYYWITQAMRREIAYSLYEMHNLNNPTEKGSYGRGISSLDELFAAENARNKGDMLPCRDTVDTASAVRSLRATFGALVKGLTGRQRDIAARRYISGWTLDQIGAEQGITRERVRQILAVDIEPHMRITAIVRGYVERDEIESAA
jgi:RNA polymerase sigma factor (sigma-70 family)